MSLNSHTVIPFPAPKPKRDQTRRKVNTAIRLADELGLYLSTGNSHIEVAEDYFDWVARVAEARRQDELYEARKEKREKYKRNCALREAAMPEPITLRNFDRILGDIHN